MLGLYVNLRNLFHFCYFFFFVCWFLLYFLLSSFYHIMMNRDVYITDPNPNRSTAINFVDVNTRSLYTVDWRMVVEGRECRTPHKMEANCPKGECARKYVQGTMSRGWRLDSDRRTCGGVNAWFQRASVNDAAQRPMPVRLIIKRALRSADVAFAFIADRQSPARRDRPTTQAVSKHAMPPLMTCGTVVSRSSGEPLIAQT